MKHYKYGGSTAARTLACPDWVANSAGAPKQPESEFANVGTALHTCMEFILEGDEDTTIEVGAVVEGVTLDLDHVGLISEALSAWDEFCVDYNIEDYLVEQTFEYSDDIGGTADVLAWSDDTVYVVDWKFGQGIEVSPNKSKQGLFYGWLARRELPELFDCKKLAVVIIQPLMSRASDTLKVWDAGAATDVCLEFETAFLHAVEHDKGTNAGAHCQFCPVSSTCDARTGVAVAAMMFKPDALKVLGHNLTLVPQLKQWIKDVEVAAKAQSEMGNAPTGFKLVNGRSSRKWTDDGLIMQHIRDTFKRKLLVSDITDSKVKSVAQMEKVFKSKKLDTTILSDYIIKSTGAPALVPNDDPRQSIIPTKGLKEALNRL
tara:strand:+ start:4289 stop:5410 length:1122 start_codon:yes stop_codon:yes gene_type:complete